MGKRRFLSIKKGVACSRMEKSGTIYLKFNIRRNKPRTMPSTQQILRECGIRSY